MALWLLGRIVPLDKVNMLNMISTLSYHEFRKRLEYSDVENAVKLARLCVSALKEIEGEKKDEILKIIRQPREHDIPILDRSKLTK